MELNVERIERYSRQIILPEVGGEGQRKLFDARVLLVGAGGLGSPAALYLAAAGVGTLGIIDSDDVDLSNLGRQIIHTTADVGRPKVESAEDRIRALNPDVRIRALSERATAATLPGILAGYDFVIDGTDNFASKYLINDACVLAGVPYSHAGIIRFQGQLLTVLPGRSACLRCLFPSPPPEGAAPTCAQAGILGPVAGVIGTLQALEAARWILGIGDLLAGRLLIYDALRARFREVAIPRDPRCPVCGESPTIRELRDEAPVACPTRAARV